MHAKLAPALIPLLAVLAAGCATVRPAGETLTPLGRGLELRLPAEPNYPVAFSATQTVVGQYGERRAAFQAILSFSPSEADIVLTTAGGPRILSVKWTAKGVRETRTVLAPDDLKGVNVLGDIFVSLWPIDQVRAALPPGVAAEEDGPLRVIRTAGRVLLQVETLERSERTTRQKLTNLDFGYSLIIVTEKDG